MFRRLPDEHLNPLPEVMVTIDGRTVGARAGDSVAAALLLAGGDACRTHTTGGAVRGPHCMMGACFDCLVAVDGRPNQQACLVTVLPGMVIETGPRTREGPR